ncbi:MAG: arsenate reductase/protein-tyrosine-phosphatase family protein [Promethearchaeota archaeon]
MATRVKVLFVCYGNRCRSPAAEYYARKYARERGLAGLFEFESAGFGSLWEGAEPHTVEILRDEEGLDLSGFRSKNLSRQMVEGADYVLTMEWARRDLLRMSNSHLPGVEEKVFALKEMAARGPDPEGSIRDPFDEDYERYREILHEIKDHVHMAVDEIARREGLVEGGAGPGGDPE